MVTINDTSLRQNVYETIYDEINAISFGASDTVTVTAAFIDDDRSFPQVVINPANVDYSDFMFDRVNGDNTKEIEVAVEIFSKKNKDQDVIGDAVADTIVTKNIPGVMLNAVSDVTAKEVPEGLKIHLRTITFQYVRRS